ncbi:VOC family protein [Flexivirga oryzae]|uniref:Putative enzyme related to lactoylglutathione lyase n=1 Tax=Flexivirga oryzae TaxID=1794944 RepID=A0A839NE92_9MICO|nr:VOC family protein [Flexivirga oryzae]MBB2894643.1 putative enzyme related to lactoylglutathione lyase [Flexivirga oryzae]
MHRSRIGVFLIDHPPETYPAAAAFWTTARGSERRATGSTAPDDPFEGLDRLPGGVMLALQRLDDGAPRLHLDIETDDIDAEVARLVAAGATVQESRDNPHYAILADPGGMIFCVVPVQTGADFDAHATTWPDTAAD